MYLKKTFLNANLLEKYKKKKTNLMNTNFSFYYKPLVQ